MANVIKDLAQIIKQSNNKTVGPYDTQAVVKRVEGNTVWVSIPGGVDETPIDKTVNCTAGDKVQVRVSGGRAWITGNASAPPTDDTTAIKARTTATEAQVLAVDAKETADAVEGIAVNASTTATTAKTIAEGVNEHFWHDSTGAHITEVTQEEWNEPTDPNYHSGGNTLITSQGMAIRDGLTNLSEFGTAGMRIGKQSETNVTILPSSVNIGKTDNAHITMTPSNIAVYTKEGVAGLSVDTGTGSETLTRTILVNVNVLSGDTGAVDLSGLSNGLSVTIYCERLGYTEYEESFQITTGTSSSNTVVGYDITFTYSYNGGTGELEVSPAAGNDIIISRYEYDYTTTTPAINITGATEINGVANFLAGPKYRNNSMGFIESRARSGNWTCFKYAGMALFDAYYTGTFSSTFTSSNFGGYRGTTQNVSIPNFGQSSVLWAVGNVNTPNTGFALLGNFDTTSITFYPYNRTSVSTAASCKLYIHLVME